MSFYCCGVRIDTLPLELAAERILAAALARSPLAVHLCNAYTLSLAVNDRAFGARLNVGDLNLPDGMPLVWIARRLGLRWLTRRVYGPDLMAEVLDRGRRLGVRHYMYGSTPEVLEALRRELESRYPGLDIAGAEAPPFRALTNAEVQCSIERMHASGADIVWTGLGTPKQDEFVHSFRDQIGLPTVAVGAAFDFFAGTIEQAPRWIQSIGLEWLFRLSREPRRLWRRYLIGNTKFLKGLVAEGTLVEWRGRELGGVERPRARVTALLASFNRREATLRCLRSLFEPSESAEMKAILVDAKSSDSTAAGTIRFPNVRVVEGLGDLSWTEAMRVAFEWAGKEPYDYLLWLNEDVELTEGAIEQLLATEWHLRASRGPTIVAGAVRETTSGLMFDSGVRRRGPARTVFHQIPPGDHPRRAETMSGNVVLVPAEVAKTVGNLDGSFTQVLAAYDYGLRAHAAGNEVWVAPRFIGKSTGNPMVPELTSVEGHTRMAWRRGGPAPAEWLAFARRHTGRLWFLSWISFCVRGAAPTFERRGGPRVQRGIPNSACTSLGASRLR